ncbi:MAG: hypothetical protein PWQ78_626, partial [Petrotoga sp.]|nr:hypothetical protein [Petrotoga sp.]
EKKESDLNKQKPFEIKVYDVEVL